MLSRRGYITVYLLLSALLVSLSVKGAGYSQLLDVFGGNISAATASDLGRADIEILPSTPTTDDNIRIKISGTWPNSCVPVNPQLKIEGSTIRIGTNIGDLVCLQVLTRWEHIVTVGKLEARTYDVVVTANQLGNVSVIGRKSLVVGFGNVPRAEIEIFPPAPTVDDNIKIRISGTGSSSCAPRDPQLKIEGDEILIATSNPGRICTQDLAPWEHTLTIGKL